MADVVGLRVLVIEDDADTAANLSDILELDSYQSIIARTAAEALDRDDWDSYAAILLDWRLPDARGETLLPELRQLAPDAAVIVSTGIGGLEGAVIALRHGAADYVTKPVDSDLLRASVRRVAEQRRLKLEKAASDAAFRGLVESADNMILIIRPDGHIAYANPFGEELMGYGNDELIDRNCVELIAEGDRQKAQSLMQQIVTDGSQHGFELQVMPRSGPERWLLWNATLLEDFSGEPAILAIGQDVTERKAAETKLLQSERLAAIGKAITGLAHESRNALQRGQANLELLALMVQDHPEALDLVKRLQRVQTELHRLYEDVRQYAAPLNLNVEPCDLRQILHDAWDELAPHRGNRDASMQFVEDTDVDLRCAVDRFQIIQVFRNILDNSLAAAPDPVRVSVFFEADRIDGREAVRISLRDNGPGISRNHAASVFDEFFTTKTKGTGLGLAIVKRIIEAHGGHVRINPAIQDGAEIQITLPRDNR